MDKLLQYIKQGLPEILNGLPALGYEMGLTCLFLLVVVWDLAKGKFFKKSLLSVVTGGLVLNYLLFSGYNQNVALDVIEGIGSHHPYLKLLFVVLSLLILLYDQLLNKIDRVGEYYAILVAILIGLSFILMAKNFLVLYLAIEAVSICSYILVAFKFDKKSSEGSLKYILFGAFSSALMLYGISLLYGLSGSLTFAEVFVHQAINEELIGKLALLLTLIGIFFKISAVPFHIWTPDVYESAPTTIASYLSVAPKAAVVYILSNFVEHLKGNEFFLIILSVVAIASILFGNLSALRQTSFKRMLAYSSIAHAGFLLIAVVASPKDHLHFYLTIYLFMNVAAFGLASWLESVATNDSLQSFNGFGLKHPFIGVVAVIVMISLAGLPITAGFNAKLLIFIDLWGSYSSSGSIWLLALFAVGLVNVVVSLFYYLKAPYFMFFSKVEALNVNLTYAQRIYFGLLSFPLLLFFFKPDWLLTFINWLS